MELLDILNALIGEEKNPDKLPTFYEALVALYQRVKKPNDRGLGEPEKIFRLAAMKPEEVQFKLDYYCPANLQMVEHFIHLARNLVSSMNKEKEEAVAIIKKTIDPSLPEDQLPEYRLVLGAIGTLGFLVPTPDEIQLIKDVLKKGKGNIRARSETNVKNPLDLIVKYCEDFLRRNYPGMSANEAIIYCLGFINVKPEDRFIRSRYVYDVRGQKHWIEWDSEKGDGASPSFCSESWHPFIESYAPYRTQPGIELD